jgi:CRP-like cAMP-binding protein
MLDQTPLSDFVASKQLASAFMRWAYPFELPANGILFRQGDAADGVYYLKTGQAILTMQIRGNPVMNMRIAAGSLLGLPAVIGNKPYSLTAVADGDAEVYKVPGDKFKKMIARNSLLCADVLRILACEVHSARTSLGKLL